MSNILNKNKSLHVVVAGFQKCGSTAFGQIALNQCNSKINLLTSPDVEFSHEIDYFTSKYDKTFDWYESLLDSDKINIDKSINYTTHNSELCAKKIHQHYPDVKLIFLIRNPIDRAYSACNHYMQEYPRSKNWGIWNFKKSFLYNFFEGTSFSKTGFYFKHINDYLKFFNKQKMLFVVAERMVGSETYQDEWNKIFDFIECPRFSIKNNTTAHKRDKPRDLEKQERLAIRDYYEHDVNLLKDLIKDDLKEWEDFT